MQPSHLPHGPTVLPNEVRFAHVASGARIAWAKSGRGPALVRVAHWMTPGARFETLTTRNHIPLPGDGGFDRFIEVVADFVASETSQLMLTPREKDLAHAVADGLDNLQIAARLGVAEKTARNALSALYAKLGVEGRPQAIVLLRAEGFGGQKPLS